MISSYDYPLEDRIRYAACILSYSILATKRLHYSDAWASLFLRELRRTEKEQVPQLEVGSYPVICHYCGKQVGTHSKYATIRKPCYSEDCCSKISKQSPNLQPAHFTVFDYMPVVDMISYYMDVPMYIVHHYATLEAIKYFNQREQRIHELSRYTNKTVIANMAIIKDLIC